MLIERHPFRQLVGALAAMMLQVIRQPIADMPVDLPVRVARVPQRKVVRPAFQLPIQLVNQSRDRRAALTTICHLADSPAPSAAPSSTAPHSDIAGRVHTGRDASEMCNPESPDSLFSSRRSTTRVFSRLISSPSHCLELLFDPASQAWPLIARQHDKVVGIAHQSWPSPTGPVHRPDETACRTNAGTGSPAAAKSLRLAAFPSSSGSTCPARLRLRPVPRLGFPATSGSVSVRSGPPLASAGTPSACRAESNRSSLSSPRHTPPDTRLSDDRVSPPAPDAPSGRDGTHRSNPRNRLRRSAPESTGSPSAPLGPAPSVSPTVAASHWPSVCRRAVPVAAGRSWLRSAS